MPEIALAVPNPLTALALFAGAAVVLALLAWPGWGLIARLRRAGDLSERVRLEDGLKHLYTLEAAAMPSSVDSLAGALGASRSRAVSIVRRLEETDLIRLETDNIVLTDEGRAYALRIVRTHRLWERYLADRTGTAPLEWHAQAERLEHGLSEDQVENLAASMGYPLYDPHGDPIPTAAGVLPPARGISLTALEVGQSARVIHVEDEPEELYRTIRRAGIHPGTLLRLEALEPTRVHLTVEGQPHVLEPLAARNLTVERVPASAAEMGVARLDSLHPGEEGVVVRLAGAVQGAQRRRLLDLGVVPGTVIRVELSSASGDPMAYRIRGAVIALRRAQADDILIRRQAHTEAA
ncbi:MAG: iron dependent repressor, metal binding and dimerization domain protein [Gemmatimonadota bacterium]|nr:iron dependent repressor, metal binding and dimerization domain protein [Gemmatimonadota bacterium]